MFSDLEVQIFLCYFASVYLGRNPKRLDNKRENLDDFEFF